MLQQRRAGRGLFILLIAASGLAGCGDDSTAGDPAAGGSAGSAGGAGVSGHAGSSGSAGGGGSAGGAGAGGSAGSPTTCPLSSEAKALVEEVIVKGFFDASFVAMESHSDPDRIGLALSLAGTTSGNLASFSPLASCAPGGAASFYEIHCPDASAGGSPFFEQIASCSRWGCTASGETLTEVWYNVRPQEALEPRHPLTYAFEAVEGLLAGRSGTVRWSQNPFELWTRTDLADGSVQVIGEAQHAFEVELDGGVSIDLSHTNHSELVNDAGGAPQSQLVDFVFSALASDTVLSGFVELTNPETGAILGSFSLNGADLVATVTQAQTSAPKLAWQGVCAN